MHAERGVRNGRMVHTISMSNCIFFLICKRKKNMGDVGVPVLHGLALAVVLRVLAFAVQVHVCILLDMARERIEFPFGDRCPRRMLTRVGMFDD